MVKFYDTTVGYTILVKIDEYELMLYPYVFKTADAAHEEAKEWILDEVAAEEERDGESFVIVKDTLKELVVESRTRKICATIESVRIVK